MIWEAVREELCADPRVSPGTFFGCSGVKFGRRIFAFEFHGDLVVKLGAPDAAAAVQAGGEAGVRHFDPHGSRPMKAWVQFPVADTGDPVRAWLELAEEAKQFVDDEE